MTVIIPALTVPSGARQLGPFAIAGGWSSFLLIFDITNLVQADIAAELSTDGGLTWRFLAGQTGLKRGLTKAGLPENTMRWTASWVPPLPAGQVRFSLTNAATFSSTGGSVTVN